MVGAFHSHVWLIQGHGHQLKFGVLPAWDKGAGIFPATYVGHIDYDLCNKKHLEFDHLICPSDAVAVDCVEGQKINLIADIAIAHPSLTMDKST